MLILKIFILGQNKLIIIRLLLILAIPHELSIRNSAESQLNLRNYHLKTF